MTFNPANDPSEPLSAKIANCPGFLFDAGYAINKWHTDNNEKPSPEVLETQVFIKLLSEEPQILDVGANVGWYSCVASAVTNGRARILAFEPEPDNFALLG